MATCYEVVNPSDAATIIADEDVVAAVAVLVLSSGRYGVERVDGKPLDCPAPLIVFGGEQAYAEWCEQALGETLDNWLRTRRADVAVCLASCLYGDAQDRASYDNAIELIESEQGKSEYRRRWEDDRRSSMNQICKRAWSMARQLKDADLAEVSKAR